MKVAQSWKLGLLFLATIIVGGGALAAQPRAVIELFTSQGCSSCPPADELLARLAKDPQIIALSLPVDYWDRLGWKDTFATPAFTQRQRAYSGVRGDGEVYTPQAVVNGKEHAVGSSLAAIDQAIAVSSPSLLVPLSAERTAAGIHVSVGAAQAGTTTAGTVIMLPILASRDVAIGRGENAHRKVTYTNIVRDIVPIASWSGKSLELDVPSSKVAGFDSVVVLLQSGTVERPGAILGSSQAQLQ